MSKVCQITGKKVMHGNNVSHSNKKTKRMKVSAAGLRTINKKGVYAAIMESAEKGNLERW